MNIFFHKVEIIVNGELGQGGNAGLRAKDGFFNCSGSHQGTKAQRIDLPAMRARKAKRAGLRISARPGAT